MIQSVSFCNDAFIRRCLPISSGHFVSCVWTRARIAAFASWLGVGGDASQQTVAVGRATSVMASSFVVQVQPHFGPQLSLLWLVSVCVGTRGGWEQVSREIVPCGLHKLLTCAKRILCIKCSPSTFNSYSLQRRVPLSMCGSAARWKPAGETQLPQLLVAQLLNRSTPQFFHLKNGGGKNGACS